VTAKKLADACRSEQPSTKSTVSSTHRYAFLRNPVSDKLGKIPSYGIVVAKVRSAQRLHMRP
jgi:hypothetical protein